MMYAVALGEMFDAINFFGPFDDFDSAESWADNNSSSFTNWWIVRLEKP